MRKGASRVVQDDEIYRYMTFVGLNIEFESGERTWDLNIQVDGRVVEVNLSITSSVYITI